VRRRSGAHPSIRAYGHALRLFFLFLARRTRRHVSTLGLDDIVVEHVLAFLDHVEPERRNRAATRNRRLAAIRGLVGHLTRNDLSPCSRARLLRFSRRLLREGLRLHGLAQRDRAALPLDLSTKVLEQEIWQDFWRTALALRAQL
jgi:hypothetical protein